MLCSRCLGSVPGTHGTSGTARSRAAIVPGPVTSAARPVTVTDQPEQAAGPSTSSSNATMTLSTPAIPAGRRMLRARLSPMLGQVLPRLLEVAQQPGKLARGIGSDPGPGSGAHLGLHAPGGNRVSQCRVVAFGLVGISLAEFCDSLVELV